MATQREADSVSEKIFGIMKKMELLAEDILADRQKMIELDRRRQKNREALRALKTRANAKDGTAPGDSRTWCVYGSAFVRLESSRAEDIIAKEQEAIEEEIENVRRRIKTTMQELSELEGRKGIQDFGLKPLSRAEKEAIHGIIAPGASSR